MLFPSPLSFVSPLVLAVLATAFVAALVPVFYALLTFNPLARAVKRASWQVLPPTDLPPLSIIVTAHNDALALYRLVPELLQQAYPNELEIVLVDDRSTDDTSAYIQQLTQWFSPLVRLVSIKSTPASLNPKKYALTLGLKVARYPHRLVTDADCVPSSEHWAARMAAGFATPDGGQSPAEVVLGFGGYAAHPTLLNLLVRHETLVTGALFLGAGRGGRAYMGVGRNLAYTKDAFTATRGFSSHLRSLGGDDDLFVQDAVRARLPVGVVLHPDGQTTSEAPTTWRHYWHQKRRHLGAGRKYRFLDRLRAGLLPLSGPLFYGLLVAAIILAPALWPWWTAAWAVRMTGLAAGFLPLARNLRRQHPFWALPALDPLFSAIYLMLGLSVLVSSPTRWK
jgi:cellulose synthase/poly-beta-1,6-N-acetylglucosamine synthase-like glycosyltransferase